MNTSIEINNKDLPTLLERIGEAIREGKNLVIQESSHPESRYVYTKIKEREIKLLGKEGKETIKVEANPEELRFSEDEISLMEETRICRESGDLVDQYYCNNLCSFRKECPWI